MVSSFLTGIGHNFGSTAETVAKRQERVRRAREIVQAAEDEIAIGLGIEDEAFDRWLDALDDDPTAPLPSSLPPPVKP